MAAKSQSTDRECDDTIELLVNSTEEGIRAACKLMMLPAKCYVRAIKYWTKAVNKAVDECKPDKEKSKD